MRGATKIFLIGSTGRMGQEVLSLVEKKRSQFLESRFTRQTSWDNPEASSADVWIDFSLPSLTSQVLQNAVKCSRPLVSGVTGLSPEQKDEMKKASVQIPVLWSSNMSLGVAALKKALEVAKGLSTFDFQIEEIHHSEKRDRPSGTAQTLQEKLSSVVGRRLPDPVSLRGGGVFGVHKVWMMGAEEVLCFEHQALSRKVFAEGALRAAAWLKNQKPGFYSIEDCLENF